MVCFTLKFLHRMFFLCFLLFLSLFFFFFFFFLGCFCVQSGVATSSLERLLVGRLLRSVLGGLVSVVLLVLDFALRRGVLGGLVSTVLLVLDVAGLWVVLGRLIFVGIVDGEVTGALGGKRLGTLMSGGETLSGLLGGVQSSLHLQIVETSGDRGDLRGVGVAPDLAVGELVVLQVQGGLASVALEANFVVPSVGGLDGLERVGILAACNALGSRHSD